MSVEVNASIEIANNFPVFSRFLENIRIIMEIANDISYLAINMHDIQNGVAKILFGKNSQNRNFTQWSERLRDWPPT